MADKEYIAKGVTIRWNGVFDLEEIYKKSKDYFDMKVMNFKEEKYVEKIKGGGKQLEIKWKATKKVSDYFKQVFEIGILVLGMTKIEVEKDDRKLILEKGEIEFQVDVYLVKNANDKFEEGSFYKKIYEYVYRKRIEGYKIDLYNSAYGLVEEIKKLMEIHA